MKRVGFSFFIVWLMVLLTVIFVVAQTLALSTAEGPTSAVPTHPSFLHFLADYIAIVVLALILAVVAFCLKEQGRVKCLLR